MPPSWQSNPNYGGLELPGFDFGGEDDDSLGLGALTKTPTWATTAAPSLGLAGSIPEDAGIFHPAAAALAQQRDGLLDQRQSLQEQLNSLTPGTLSPLQRGLRTAIPTLLGAALMGKEGIGYGLMGGAQSLRGAEQDAKANYVRQAGGLASQMKGIDERLNGLTEQGNKIYTEWAKSQSRLGETTLKHELELDLRRQMHEDRLVEIGAQGANSIAAAQVRAAGGGRGVLDEEVIAGRSRFQQSGDPKDLSPKDPQLSSFLWNRTANEGQDLKEEKVKRDNEEIQTEGFELIPGHRPRPAEAQKFRDELESINVIRMHLGSLRNMVAQDGGMQITGKAAQQQIVTIGSIIAEHKKRFGAGAALTQLEADLMQAVLPRIMTNPLSSFAAVVTGAGLGRDPLDAISTWDRVLDSEMTERGRAHGYARKSAPPDASPGGSGNRVEQLKQQLRQMIGR